MMALAETPANRIRGPANQIRIATRTFTNPSFSCTTRSSFRLLTARTDSGKTMTSKATGERGLQPRHARVAQASRLCESCRASHVFRLREQTPITGEPPVPLSHGRSPLRVPPRSSAASLPPASPGPAGAALSGLPIPDPRFSTPISTRNWPPSPACTPSSSDPPPDFRFDVLTKIGNNRKAASGRHSRHLHLRPWPLPKTQSRTPDPDQMSDPVRHLSDPCPIPFRPTTPSTSPTARNRLACCPKIGRFRFSDIFGHFGHLFIGCHANDSFVSSCLLCALCVETAAEHFPPLTRIPPW